MTVIDRRAAGWTATGLLALAAACGRPGAAVREAAAAATGSVDARALAAESGLIPAETRDSAAAATASIVDRMKYYHVPGVSVAVIEQGRIAWARGYGVIEADRPAAIDTATLFQAASISKPVTTVAVLKLVDRGVLRLDEDVNVRLRSWHVPASEYTGESKVTLRRILTHSAGLSVSGFAGYVPGEPLPTLNQVLDGSPPANSPPVRVEFVPGTRQVYSGGGFVVAQRLVADAARKPFAAALSDLVLGPAGMVHSTFEQPLPRRLEPSAAAGHDTAGHAIAGRWRLHPEMAAAGLWTTPSDLARLAIAIQDAASRPDGGIVSRESATALLTRQMGPSALGFVVVGEGDTQIFRHSGSNVGFRAQMVAFVRGGRGAVVMTNGDGGAALTDEIIDSVARAYHWPTRRIR